MQTLKFDNREDWMLARRGKITGSRLKDIIVKRGTGKKKGFYELIAERVAIAPDGERPMDRGTRLEDIAIERFTKETGKKVDISLVLWVSEDSESIAVSPDGVVEGMKNKEAVEVKCLNSASHVEAVLTKEVPTEYKDQVIQYFIVNPVLDILYFVFYDPRMISKDYFLLIITRDSLGDKIEEYKEYQLNEIAEVEQIVSEWLF